MAIVEAVTPDADGHRRLALKSPATGESAGEITVTTPDEVREAIARARAAQPAWAAKSVTERADIIRKGIDVLVKRRNEVVETVCRETGKPHIEALMIEVIPSVDFMNYWSARAKKDLADHWRPLHGYLKPFKKLLMHYRPRGVVGVITPWNGPFALSMNPTVQALLAGNAVLLKPSEVTPHSGAFAAKILHEAGVPADVLQVLHGDGETGAALVSGEIDKISFTGSVATGKRIAAACAERLIPVTLELGGKDALIVCDDADLEKASLGALYLSTFNTGQVCMGTERIYVMEAVADEFIAKLKAHAEKLRYGAEAGIGSVDVGSLFWDRQLDIVSRHVEDAKLKGARVLVGGEADLAKGVFYKPTVIVDVDHDMDLMRQETFGPVVAIMRVKDEAEAIKMANDCQYGLSGSVFTKDTKRFIRIAKQLETGSVCQNDAATIYGVPEAPFGGVKDSGLGHVNGLDALRSYSHAQPLLIDRWQMTKEAVWYPYGEKAAKQLDQTIQYGFGTFLRRFMS